jgi:hypothetical protein
MTKFDKWVVAAICGLIMAGAALLSFGWLESGTLAMSVAAVMIIGYPLWRWEL